MKNIQAWRYKYMFRNVMDSVRHLVAARRRGNQTEEAMYKRQALELLGTWDAVNTTFEWDYVHNYVKSRVLFVGARIIVACR